MEVKIIFSKGGIKRIHDIVSIERLKFLGNEGEYIKIFIKDKNCNSYVYDDKEIRFITIDNKGNNEEINI